MELKTATEIRAMNTMVRMQTKYTPDYPVLQDLKAHLFFIVGDFQHGCRNNIHMGDSGYGCRAFTNSGFECWRESLTDKVIPFYGSRRPELVDNRYFARVKGEVWKVPTKQIPKLDTEMRNTLQFIRKRIILLAPERQHVIEDNGHYDASTGLPLPPLLDGFKHWVSDERIIILRAWAYTAIRDYWNPIIDGLNYDRLEMHDDDRPWLRQYYKFNKRRNE